MYPLKYAQRMSWGAVLAAGATAQVVLALALARGPLPGLNVDDALHALAGAATWHDVVRLDLRSLYLDIYDQGRWPPVGGLLQWPALAFFGPSEATHRLGMLMWLVACVATWAATARAAAEEVVAAAWAGVLVCLLALSSQVLLTTSASVLCEVPGLAFMLGAYGAAHAAWRRRAARLFWLAGLLLAAAWFTKWQYGIVATLSLLVVLLRQRRLGMKVPGELRLFVPSALLLAIWLASPYHLREMVLYLLWKPASPSNLRDYAMTFLRAVADATPLAKANLAATVVGVILAILTLRRPAAIALAVHLALAGLGSSLKDLSLRTGLWIAIPAWALAAAGWGRLLARHLPRRLARTALAVAGGVAVVLALHTAFAVSRQFASMAWAGRDWYRPEAQFVAAEIPFGARLLTVGGWRRFISPYHIKLHGLAQNWHRRFPAREVKIAEYPSLEWEPWRLWRPSLRALFKLRRPDTRPPRPQVAPEYVAVFNLSGDSHLAEAMADLESRLILEPWRHRAFPGGTAVTIYRSRGWRPAVGKGTAS